MTDIRASIETLLPTLALSEGGWGYWSSQSIHFEPTCLAVLALANEPRHRPLIEKAVAALDKESDGAGLFRLGRGRPQAIWPTGMVVFTRCAMGQSASVSRSIAKLLEIRGHTVKGDPEVQTMFDIDTERVGWPWAMGTFSWVEPTAWAVFALRAAGHGNHPRVIEGAKMLLDRAFDSGGINYGNRKVLEAMTEPIPGPTATMLLALQGHNEPRVQAARHYLMDAVANMDDLEHLGWAKLALSCNSEDPAIRDFLLKLDDRIRNAYTSQTAEGRPVSVLRCGVSREATVPHTTRPGKLEAAGHSRFSSLFCVAARGGK